MRLDQLLVARGLAETRAQARALIMEGRVFSGERRLDKPGTQVAPDLPLEVRMPRRWVSRGGDKLARALAVFPIDPAGKVAIDVGASTGGFTDVLLHHGARRVYAVDVGYGQLHPRLRADPRVVVLERTNARYLTREQVPEPVDLVVCDASFIPLRLVLPAPLALTRPGAELIALIKPQFEAGRERVGKGGGVRDARVHRQVLREVVDWAIAHDFGPQGLIPSPILGPKGNREFLAWLQPGQEPIAAETLVERALA